MTGKRGILGRLLWITALLIATMRRVVIRIIAGRIAALLIIAT